MRIAMISMHTSPLDQPGVGDAGGMNVYVLNIARQLARQGKLVDVYTRATRPSQGEVVEVEDNLRVINVVAGPYEGLAKDELPTQLAAFAGGVLEFVRCFDLEYDLIHSHYWLSGQVGWLLRDLWHAPLVHTAHTLAAVKNSYRAEDDTPESEARRICEQQLVDNADVLVVNTEEEIKDLVSHYDADRTKVAVVAPGADIELFTPGSDRNTERSRRQLGIPLHAKVVAFVGRLQEFKGPQVLIRAVAELVERDPGRNLRVLICGGASGVGTTPEHYGQMVQKLGLSGRVRFLDPRPPSELVTVYQAADILAVPSYNESFGLVAMEAQSTGTPVVAARVGGLEVVVADGETGLLIEGHGPESWADGLDKLLEDNELRIAMGERAVGHAAKFSWSASATRMSDVYSHSLTLDIPDCHARRAGA